MTRAIATMTYEDDKARLEKIAQLSKRFAKQCDLCGRRPANAGAVRFLGNVGLLVRRYKRELQAEICGPCLHSRLLGFTLVNLIFGWWGTISMLVTPAYILNNFVEFGQSGGRLYRLRRRKAELRSVLATKARNGAGAKGSDQVGWPSRRVRVVEAMAFPNPHKLIPLHIRRGLLRVYIAACVPWIAFFGYRFLDALQRDYYRPYTQHQAFGAFWSLLVVPVGGPISLLVILWVLAGFRKSGQTASEADQQVCGMNCPSPGRPPEVRS
jgi:hypothetical protein